MTWQVCFDPTNKERDGTKVVFEGTEDECRAEARRLNKASRPIAGRPIRYARPRPEGRRR